MFTLRHAIERVQHLVGTVKGRILLACLVLLPLAFFGMRSNSKRIQSTAQDHRPRSGIFDDMNVFTPMGETTPNTTALSSLDVVYTEKVNPPGTCILDPADMPKSWWNVDQIQDTGHPWTATEQNLANRAAQTGLEELIDFYNSISLQRLKNLGGDAINSIMDQCYSSTNMPRFHNLACEAGSRILKVIVQEFVSNDATNNECVNMHLKTKLVCFAHYLLMTLPGDSELRHLRSRLVEDFRDSWEDCITLNGYLQVEDWEALLNTPQMPRITLRELAHYSNYLTGLYTIPELELPAEVDHFTARLWKYVATYNYTAARNVPNGFNDAETRHMAFLVTHIAYMPTGYARHMQYVEDAPWLYHYIRENFVAAVTQGGLDLLSEFVDILRQYGCTEDNDLMVRFGSRHLLQKFVTNNYSWMYARDHWSKPPSDYNLIHVPWTCIAGVRRKQMEPTVPGSFGYAFWKALERAAANDHDR